MGDRSVLGPADVDDDQLTAMVAAWLGFAPDDVSLADVTAERVGYDLDAITTAGRYWVHALASTPEGPRPVELFVKHIQCWSRSPQFSFVPPEYQAMAADGVPWYTEALVYRSDLARRLPPGLGMPRALAVIDLDEKSAAIWLERVPAVDRDWTVEQLAHAAHLLGRLAGSPAVRELAGIGERRRRFSVRDYVQGRLGIQVLPMLRDDGLWRHPLLAGAFDADLRRRLLSAADQVPDLLAEIEAAPVGTAHGDACTNNLLVRADSHSAGADELVLIDYGFWTCQPLGFDLSQLLLGDVQLGRRPAATLPEVEAAIVPAYIEGLRAEGVDGAGVARIHALCALIYSGLSAFPMEHLGAGPTPDLHRVAAERAALASFLLDLAGID